MTPNHKRIVRAFGVFTVAYLVYSVALLATGQRYDAAIDTLAFDVADAWAWLLNSFSDGPNRPVTVIDVLWVATPAVMLVVGFPRKTAKALTKGDAK